MGLFDNFYFKTYKLKRNILPKNLGELSLKEIQDAQYQTKDLGETFVGHFYLKKKDGVYRLFKHDIEYKWIEGDKKAKSLMDRLGHMEEISSKEILIDDIGTNTINVYNFFSKENHDYWVEFALVFLENELLKIDLHEFREEKNDDKKVFDLEFNEKMRKSVEFYKTPLGKIIHLLREIYLKTLWRFQIFIGNIFIKIGNAIKLWRLL
jgi:hypothetical protein